MPKFRFFCVNVLPDLIKTIAKHRAIEYLMRLNLRAIQINLNYDYLIVFIDSDIPTNEVRIGYFTMEIQYFLLYLIPQRYSNSLK